MRIAVTGANGFIGKNLVSTLKSKGFDVLEISRSKGIDLKNWNEVKDLAPCDHIIHLAARTFVPDSFDNPREFYLDNHSLTVHALELARKWKARFTYMSSYLYGPPQYIPVDEKHSVNPHNPYAQTKHLSEELCQAYARDFGIDVLSFRLFNIYGPGQIGSFLIPEVIEKLQANPSIQLKDPRPKRDYVYVKDVVAAILAGLEAEFSGFEALNLGTGSSTSVEDLLQHFVELMEGDIQVSYSHEYRKGEVLDSVADLTRLKQVLNFSPQTSLKEGLRETIEFALSEK